MPDLDPGPVPPTLEDSLPNDSELLEGIAEMRRDPSVHAVADMVAERVLAGLAAVLRPLTISQAYADYFAGVNHSGMHVWREFFPLGPSSAGVFVELYARAEGALNLRLLDVNQQIIWEGKLSA